MPGRVLLIATLDTKGDELAYVRNLLAARGQDTLVLDAGIMRDPAIRADIPAREVAESAGADLTVLRTQGDRGVALAAMSRGAAIMVTQLHAEGRIHAVLGIGGSCGTAIATAAMRELPVGLPKLMVSTMASGQVAPYVGVKDITMMYSVVDIAGLNRISRHILSNAAGAVCGMLDQPAPRGDKRRVIAATMFGVTTPCVERVREKLSEVGFEVLVFHATGSGGRAMEGLISAGFIDAVADVTTTEWADELVGGVLTAGPDRLNAASDANIPQVVSLGALDMVNFGAMETVPEKFRNRTLHVHNPSVTLMRTTPEECARLGEIIAEKLNRSSAATCLMIPLRGVSALDHEGQKFHDPAADAALFEALRRNVAASVNLIELDMHINDPEFADAIAGQLLATIQPAGNQKTGRVNAVHHT